MITSIILALTFFNLLKNIDTSSDENLPDDFAELFLQGIPLSSRHVRKRTVPAYVKKLFEMEKRRSSFSQISCIFGEENKALQKEAMAFTFQLKSVKNVKEARPIQLRVFKRRSKDRNPHDMYFIHLYQSHEFISNVSFITNKSLSTRLIGSRFVRNSRGEWLTFDVTSAILSKLVRQTEINFFIEVKSVKYLSDSKPISIAKGGRKQPFMLIYFPLPLQKLSKAAMGGHIKQNSNNFPLRTSTLTRFPRSLSSSLCSRKSMTINFQQLGYSSILHPQTYNAHTCAGICPAFSGSKHQKYTYFYEIVTLEKAAAASPPSLSRYQYYITVNQRK